MKYTQNYSIRYCSLVLLIVSMMVLPWWVSLVLAGIAIFIFPILWETIVMVVIYDSLYMTTFSTPRAGIMTVITIVIFLVAYYLRPRLSWYEA